jgi:hypothetical protein
MLLLSHFDRILFMVAMVKWLTLTTVTRTYVGSNPTSHPILKFLAV